MNGRGADLYLSDGPYSGAPWLDAAATVIRHDNLDGQVPERVFKVLGGSHMSVMCPTVERRDALATEVGRLFPVQIA